MSKDKRFSSRAKVFVEAIKDGREKPLKKVVLKGWEADGFHDCYSLAAAICMVVHSSKLADRQLRLAKKYICKLSRSFVEVEPEQLVRMANYYYHECFQVIDFVHCFNDIDDIDMDYSVKYFDILCRARALVWEKEDIDGKSKSESMESISWLAGIQINRKSRIWEGFIQAVTTDNKQAFEILKNIFSHYEVFGDHAVKFVDERSFNAVSRISDGKDRDLIMSLWGWATDRDVLIPIRSDLYSEFMLKITQIEVADKQETREWRQLIDWFRMNWEDFQIHKLAMWEEIINDPVTALLSDGLDKIELNLFPEHEVTVYKYIQLSPDFKYPDVSLMIWQESGGIMIGMPSKLSPDIPCKPEPQDLTNAGYWGREILEYIALSCYYSIVTEKEVEPSVCTDGSNLEISNRQSSPLRAHFFRPRFRRLPAGQKISQRAKELALKTRPFRLPPTGKTFVSDFWRGGKERDTEKHYDSVRDIPPVITYSLEEIGFKTE